MEIPKAYDSKSVEHLIYERWEKSGFFTPENLPNIDKAKGNFTAMIAPPNITGELHMGHSLENTLADIIIRLKRMQGYKVLWLPGLDHAGIGAQNVVEKQLAKEGTSRHKIGREKFLERMAQWKEKYGHIILDQFKKLGLSLDWTRLRYTMDPEYQKAVEHAFHHYHKKGWIYKGHRVINWCVRCSSSISDLEVNYVPEVGKLYFIKYGPFTLATARPETKLGDTALAVHPEDERYKEYVGKDLEIESVDSSVPADQPAQIRKIKIRVVADESVDIEFGTGIIKVTPAHDGVDFEIGQRNKLEIIQVIDNHGKMNENAGIRYQGLKTAEARGKIVEDLKDIGLIEKIKDYEHNIGRCDRCNSVIEPIPSDQWFLRMKELAAHTIESIEKKEVRIHSEKWSVQALQWLRNIRDWNISRQLWWGHKIPLEGEEDVLDTWFSSALWPFATLGWPNKTKDLEEYYPTNFITSDRGILYLWQMRMIFSGKEFMGKTPFSDMLIHATVLTKDGKRMSKSLGTGVNPLELIEKYGADALRFGLTYQTTDLQDLKFGEDTILMGKKFANKIWNIARYILLRHEDKKFEVGNVEDLPCPIRDTLSNLVTSIPELIDKYQFGEAAHRLYDFAWHDLADKYLEETKDKKDDETLKSLATILITLIKILHPFMPFITEEIYSLLPLEDKRMLLVERWPS